MKRINHIIKGMLLVSTVAFMASCQKDFGDTNVNNNQPSDVPVNIILPSAQASLAYTLGGDIARYNAVLDQNVTGAYRQFFGYNIYSFTEEDFNNLWNNMYSDNMSDLNRIIEKANAADGSYNSYRGVARIMMAYSLSTMTDLFGDVPYREAFQGNGNLTPAYDSQQDIYTNIIPGLISAGIADIDNSGDDILTPGADDVIYQGDLDKWKQLANALTARLAIHTTKLDSVAAGNAALAALAAGAFSSSDDDAQFMFGTNYQNPWFQYIDQRADISYSTLDYYYGIGCYHTDMLQSLSDPRFGKMIDVNGDYYAPGFPSAYYMADNAPVALMTYVEQKFIEAEAKLNIGDDAGAEAALHEAVTASMNKLGVDPADDAAYQSANVVWGGSNSEKLELIIFQKYLANYLQPESYTDWRRTGFPELVATAGNLTGDNIPRRYIYPTNERQNNPNSANSSSSLFEPALWWDAQ